MRLRAALSVFSWASCHAAAAELICLFLGRVRRRHHMVVHCLLSLLPLASATRHGFITVHLGALVLVANTACGILHVFEAKDTDHSGTYPLLSHSTPTDALLLLLVYTRAAPCILTVSCSVLFALVNPFPTMRQ